MCVLMLVCGEEGMDLLTDDVLSSLGHLTYALKSSGIPGGGEQEEGSKKVRDLSKAWMTKTFRCPVSQKDYRPPNLLHPYKIKSLIIAMT